MHLKTMFPLGLMVRMSNAPALLGKQFLESRDKIDTGIDRNTAQHNESGKSALVKRKIRQSKHKKLPNKRHRNHQDYGYRVPERIEVYRTYHENTCNHKQYESRILVLIVVKPASLIVLRLISHRKNRSVHIINQFGRVFRTHLQRTEKIEPHRYGI